LFKLPEAYLPEKETQVVVGLDGRKMSKSYGNTIELFLDEHELHSKVMKIVTSTQSIDEKKTPENSYIFSLYKLFTTREQQDELAHQFKAGGMSWSYAKEELFKVMNAYLKPMRKKYEYFKNNQFVIDEIWRQSNLKLREMAGNKMRLIRKELGVSKTYY
jgi:tryptophanyl-tRNA synthetase